MQKTDLNRFHIAQSMSYDKALGEIKNGIKTSHWMWYIFPQLKGLGKSPTSQFYGISNLEEAKAYLDDEILGPRLKEITNALLNHSNKRIETILGDIDSKKLKSSMTLFDIISPNDVFQVALETFFGGKRCKRTPLQNHLRKTFSRKRKNNCRPYFIVKSKSNLLFCSVLQ